MVAVPLYKQSFGFSCGPAALMMVMKELREDIQLNRDLELDLWRDATLIESKGSSSFGLALAAVRRGFGATVRTESDRIGFTERLKDHFPWVSVDFMEMLFDHTRKRALEEGVLWDRKKVLMEDIGKVVDSRSFPIVLISSEMMGEKEGIPHWVVVTDIQGDTVHINNPETGEREAYSTKIFHRFLGFAGYRCMLILE